MTVRVGVFGTSWWSDTMYLPPLANHPAADVVAVCGRRASTTEAFASLWDIPAWFTDPDDMLEQIDLDAVVIATANNSHHALALAALSKGLHVLCEKPLALNVAEAEEMASAAIAAGVHTLVPFTYHYMPANRWVHKLIADGYVGRPLHVNLRYYTSFGFETDYAWRFDRELAGSGIIGDLGSHWIHLARWLLADTEVSVSAMASTFIERGSRPDGSAYEPLEDSAVLNVRYTSGAYGVLQMSSVCWEGTPFGQSQHLEIHGTNGTIYATCDWDTVQEVRGLQRGDARGPQPLPIPDEIWNGVRRDTVHNTYRDVFRETDAMTRGWITQIASGSDPQSAQPDFAEGLAVQRVLDASVASAAQLGCAVDVEHH